MNDWHKRIIADGYAQTDVAAGIAWAEQIIPTPAAAIPDEVDALAEKLVLIPHVYAHQAASFIRAQSAEVARLTAALGEAVEALEAAKRIALHGKTGEIRQKIVIPINVILTRIRPTGGPSHE